jgi:hypothetical protein
MVLGTFGFDPLFNDPGAWVDEEQRLIVAFDPRGDTFDIEVAKTDFASRRAFKKCVEQGKTDLEFRVCSDGNSRRAFWSFGAHQISYELCDTGFEDTPGKTYYVRVCSDPRAKDSRRVEFSIANQEAQKGVDAYLKCSCSRLLVDRLSFNPQLRSLSFNMDTDAKMIAFAGGEFQVPMISSSSLDGKLSMQVPVFTILFNEQWQIVGMTAAPRETPAIGHTAAPPQQ